MFRQKYPISREFFPFNLLHVSITPRIIDLSQKWMKAPGFLWKDPELETKTVHIPAYKDGTIEAYVISPKNIAEPAPCFVNIHGGGFVFEGFVSHYRHAVNYAKQVRCKVVYVRYRLAPKYPFPYPQEDCCAALCWVYDHADELGIDRNRIGIGGDSAGGALSVISCMMARDRGHAVKPLFQLLIYPWLDGRNCSDSYKRYTDTPMWNSTMSKDVTPLINPDPDATPLAYRSPVEAESFAGMPRAYIETAEFDPLHDDGSCYAELLRKEGIPAELHETKGTMHGFDARLDAPTTKKCVANRIDYMRRMFETQPPVS